MGGLERVLGYVVCIFNLGFWGIYGSIIFYLNFSFLFFDFN